MEKVIMEVYSIIGGQTFGTYTLILSEAFGERKLPIVISANNAKAIASITEDIPQKRPFIHDLFTKVLEKENSAVKQVEIYNIEEGVFFSKITIVTGNKENVYDSRTSDAISMAVRFNCPILVDPKVMESASIILDEMDIEEPEKPESPKKPKNPNNPNKFKDELKSLTMEELKTKLEHALNIEDYVKAAIIRDEMSGRK